MNHKAHLDPKKGVCRVGSRSLPAIGFGTYPYKGEVCTKAVKNAIEAGYQFIDTATMYENYDGIAAAIKDVERDQLYITSKVWYDKQHAKDVKKDIETALKELGTDYLDGYLIHWPNSTVPIEETLGAMQELCNEGKVREIGLCNVTVGHLEKVLACSVPITWVQIEMHPFFYDEEVLAFCAKNEILVQAWRPLKLGEVMNDALLGAIAKKHQKTPCQVALRWILQHGVLPLPGSKSPEHIEENFQVFDFALTVEEMTQLNQRAKNGERYRMVEDRGFGFVDEFDYTKEQCWPGG